MANSVDPDQTAPFGAVCSGSTLFDSILNSPVMLGNYLQQTTLAEDIFIFIFFLALLKSLDNEYWQKSCFFFVFFRNNFLLLMTFGAQLYLNLHSINWSDLILLSVLVQKQDSSCLD